MPSLYIITGSNGAGKSTVGPDYLPTFIQQNCTVFDGDKLFMEKQRELWKNGIRAIRVLDRTKEGGHYVDPLTVASNFYGNLEKLNQHHTMFDSLQIIDTSETEHKVLCIFTNGKIESAISSALLPDWFKTNLPQLTGKIKINENIHFRRSTE